MLPYHCSKASAPTTTAPSPSTLPWSQTVFLRNTVLPLLNRLTKKNLTAEGIHKIITVYMQQNDAYCATLEKLKS